METDKVSGWGDPSMVEKYKNYGTLWQSYKSAYQL